MSGGKMYWLEYLIHLSDHVRATNETNPTVKQREDKKSRDFLYESIHEWQRHGVHSNSRKVNQ